jgi:hypothetical protein
MPPRYSTEGRSARSPAATTRGDGARQTAIREVQQRGEGKSNFLGGILGAIGEYTRQQIIKGIQEGGTPVRDPKQGNMVIGVRSPSGAYTGRDTLDQILERGRGEGVGQQQMMGAGDMMGAAEEEPTGPRVRTELGQKLEEENRRRRLAGLRRLGTRTLLGSDRFGTDTLGS